MKPLDCQSAARRFHRPNHAFRRWLLIIGTAFFLNEAFRLMGAPLKPVVEVEEDLYFVRPANNGAGPMWCAGSSTLVRHRDRVFASGIETLGQLKPLNNVRWMLFERDALGWDLRASDPLGRTREPCPLGVFPNGSVVLSGNPTLRDPQAAGGGEAQPELWWFGHGKSGASPRRVVPEWDGSPKFSEHSYRSLAIDAGRRELLLLQNIGYTHAEWALLANQPADRATATQARGQLKWPEQASASGASANPVRVCYPAVALRNRQVHFFGVSDIIEPNPEWRAHKRQLSGQEWDYDFRRLFYTWTPEIGGAAFVPWIEIASREATAGFTWPCDLWLGPKGEVHLVWTERAVDERLRSRFFPDARQSHSLNYAILRDGKVELRKRWFETAEGEAKPIVSAARFHSDPSGRLLVVYFVSGAGVAENRIAAVQPNGELGMPQALALKRPFSSFFTANERAGSQPSRVLDLLGTLQGQSDMISYARIRLW